MIYNLFKKYFDDDGVSTWTLDSGLTFDSGDSNTNDIVATVESLDWIYTARETFSLRARAGVSINIVGVAPIDLSRHIPAKDRQSQLMIDLLSVCSNVLGIYNNSIYINPQLQHANKITGTYLRLLGEQIGVKWPPYETITDEAARILVTTAPERYKIKGTYRSIQSKLKARGWNANVWDLYSKDYSAFVEKAWQIFEEGQLPSGLTDDYSKTPHFGIQVALENIKQVEINDNGDLQNYLWNIDDTNNLLFDVESVRPVVSVPHYTIILNGYTDVSGTMKESIGDVYAMQVVPLGTDERRFDDDESSTIWTFDDSQTLDSGAGAYTGITEWKLYSGNYGDLPDDSGFVLTDEVASGTVMPVNYSDRIEFIFDVGKTTTFSGANALGISNPSLGELKIWATFPNIDKDENITLRIKIISYKGVK